MPEAIGNQADSEPTGRLKQMIEIYGAEPYPIDEAQWFRQFGSDTPYDPNRKFYNIQGEGTLECTLYDGETYECLGWLARY